MPAYFERNLNRNLFCYLIREKQGQGIGKKLLNAVNEYSRERGMAGLVLYTSAYAPAAKFYEKNGFQVSQGTICMYLKA